MAKEYTMSQVAKMLGVHRDSIEYWEKNNMIPKPRRNPNNNYRVYSKEEIEEIAKLRGIPILSDIPKEVSHFKREKGVAQR